MFPLAKLAELSPRTRLRKIARIVQGLELELRGSGQTDLRYLFELLNVVEGEAPADALSAVRKVRERFARGRQKARPSTRPLSMSTAETIALGRDLNAVRHGILRELGAEPAEWDLVSEGSGLLDRTGVRVHPISAYLEDIRSPFNVGSMFRTGEAFGVERMLLSPRTPAPTHPRARKTAMGAQAVLAWEFRNLESLSGEAGLFALELGGTAIGDFEFPSRGMVLVGSEELGLSPEALIMADSALGRVSIPLSGAKRSLNVSVAFGILMQAWHASLSSTRDEKNPQNSRGRLALG
jgi:TrmH family RNA methyltransferase